VNSKALWYLTRGSGIVALVLLTIAVVVGLLTAGRWSGRRWPRFVVEGLHRNISLLAPVFVIVHIASSVLDKYVSIRWLDAIVPFGASYKPLWLGIGALSFDVFLAVAITSLVRTKVGHRTWRAVHWLAYACFSLAVVHGLGIGSDRHQLWFLALNVAAVGSVAAALAWRLLSTGRRPADGGTRQRPYQPLSPTMPARPMPTRPMPARPMPARPMPEGALR
jgi:predicted ferric reductase